MISYASYKERRETEEENKLKEKIQKFEGNLKESSLDELESFKAQLQDTRNRKVDGMIMRSRVKWLKDGEKGP